MEANFPTRFLRSTYSLLHLYLLFVCVHTSKHVLGCSCVCQRTALGGRWNLLFHLMWVLGTELKSSGWLHCLTSTFSCWTILLALLLNSLLFFAFEAYQNHKNQKWDKLISPFIYLILTPECLQICFQSILFIIYKISFKQHIQSLDLKMWIEGFMNKPGVSILHTMRKELSIPKFFPNNS